MAFEISEVVVLDTSLTYSGTTFDLTEASGTVINRQLSGIDTEGNDLFLYEVELFDPLTVGSGTSTITQDTFWFSEFEIIGGAEAPATGPNLGVITENYNTSLNTISTSKSNVEQTLQQIKLSSPYYVDVSGVLDKISLDESELSSVPPSNLTTEEEINTQAVQIDQKASNFSTNALVLQEISDNLFGFYTVVDEIETQAVLDAELSSEQEKLAAADDAANSQIFYSTFIDDEGSKSLLVPSDTVSSNNQEDLTDQADDSNLDPDQLILPSLELETGDE